MVDVCPRSQQLRHKDGAAGIHCCNERRECHGLRGACQLPAALLVDVRPCRHQPADQLAAARCHCQRQRRWLHSKLPRRRCAAALRLLASPAAFLASAFGGTTIACCGCRGCASWGRCRCQCKHGRRRAVRLSAGIQQRTGRLKVASHYTSRQGRQAVASPHVAGVSAQLQQARSQLAHAVHRRSHLRRRCKLV